MIKQSVPNPKVVIYHLGFLYIQTTEGKWYVDDLRNDPFEVRTLVDYKRFVLARDALLLLAEHAIAELKGLELREYPGLEKPWAPLGIPMDGNKSLSGVTGFIRDQEEVHGLPLTRTHTWWLSSQFGLKGDYEIVGGRPYEMRWVFKNRQPFVYWSGLLGELMFGEPPDVAILYSESIPIIGAENRYYFSRDGQLWFARNVEGWTFATRGGIGLYLPDGRIEVLKGWL